MSHINQAVVAVGTVTQTIGRQTKQVVKRVADAVLITHAVILVAVLAAGALFLL